MGIKRGLSVYTLRLERPRLVVDFSFVMWE